MPLTASQTFWTIASITLATMLTLFFPFLIFRKHTPKVVSELGRILPPAMMGFLVLYCFKSVSFLAAPYGLPEMLAVAVVIALQLWKSNSLLSIGGGTALYMVLIRVL